MTDTAPSPPRWTEYQAVADLVPAVRNAKDHDQAALGASVREFGFIEPVVLDERTGRLLAGHGRTEYLGQLQAQGAEPPDGVVVGEDGRWQVQVVRGIASRDDAHADAMAIALNRVGERGGWRTDVLSDVLADLAFDPSLIEAAGWTADELDDLIAATAAPAPDPWKDRKKHELPDPGSFTGGQVWQIGPHRLVVGDSRDPAAWAWLPEAHLLITDPPYGIGYTGGPGHERVAIDDDEDPQVAAALLDKVLAQAGAKLADGVAELHLLARRHSVSGAARCRTPAQPSSLVTCVGQGPGHLRPGRLPPAARTHQLRLVPRSPPRARRGPQAHDAVGVPPPPRQ